MKNNIIRKAIFSLKNLLLPHVHSTSESQIYLKEKIQSGEPFMAARFGAVEIKALLYSILPPPIRYIFKKWAYHDMYVNAGFFPINEKTLKKFAILMLDLMNQIDILGSWRIEEVFFKKRLKNSYKITLGDLGPVRYKGAWSSSLKDKSVLVIHPFAESIQYQYNTNRSHLFGELSDTIIPQLKSLITIKSVQSIAGNNEGFKDWFEALDYMKSEIDKQTFDVALIGCGAYGMPLAAHIKSIGKQAIHIGGPLQLYFGIKGQRWNNSNLYNEYWISPNDNEKPKNFNAVENGCYW